VKKKGITVLIVICVLVVIAEIFWIWRVSNASKGFELSLIVCGTARNPEKFTKAVIKDNHEWEVWWEDHAQEGLQRPDIDFTSQMLIAVTSVCPDTSFNFEVDKVCLDASGRLRISVVNYIPGPDTWGMDVIFRNFQVYSVERRDEDYYWTIRDQIYTGELPTNRSE